MLLQKFLLVIMIFSGLFFTSPSLAGGLNSYTGTISSTNAGISSGSGSSASTSINLDFKVPRFMALGVYDANGVNSNALFSRPSSNFSLKDREGVQIGTPLLTASITGGILLTDEANLNSKFDLDGVSSISDASTIINAMNATANSVSQDLIIKGVIYQGGQTSIGSLVFSTNTNNITMTGGTGSAPVFTLRAFVGDPNGGGVSSWDPQSSIPSGGQAFTQSGYARFVLVGDLSELSVRKNTKGNWVGSFTITLTGI